MRLSDAQIAQYDRDGYLFFPALFSAAEMAPLLADLPGLLARQGPEVVREPNHAEAIRVLYGSHVFSEAYGRLSRHPRLLNPVRQLLRDEAYIHQTRLNPKQDFAGEIWSWHQDFGTWHLEDGMPKPRCVVTAVFLDAATAANAPFLLVPGSQHHGLIAQAELDRQAQGYTLLEIDRAALKDLVERHGLEALTGVSGSVAFLHCNLVHGSANNITPYRRAIVYTNYNAVSNACVGGKRAWHHSNPDHKSLEALADDCLLALQSSDVPV